MNYEIKTMAVSELKPHPKNPRVHPEDMLKKLSASIQEFGFTNPILISEDSMILAGHARCKAAERTGLTEVPCIVLPLKGLSADAYCIADNKIHELSEWDGGKLAELFKGFETADFDVELTGFSIDEIDALFTPNGCIEDDFDEEKANEKIKSNGGAVTGRGDIYILGEHRLMCGDASTADDISTLLDGEKAQLCVTSPPKVTADEYGKYGLEQWFGKMQAAIKNICRHANIVCWNIGDLYTTGTQYTEPLFAYTVSMFGDNGFRPLWTRVWQKRKTAVRTGSASTAKPAGDTEYVGAFASVDVDDVVRDESSIDISEHTFITAFGNSGYRFVKRLSREERREWGYASMWQGRGKKNSPVELPWRCIKMHSGKGDIILDSFGKTGSIIIACEQLGRRCYSMESDETACDVAVRRYREYAPDREIYVIRNGETIPIDETGLDEC